MWIDCDDEYVLINTEVHRQKFKNVERQPLVAVCIWDRDDPYHYIEVRGDGRRDRPRRPRLESTSTSWRCATSGGLYDGDTIESERVILRIRPDWVEEHGGQGR